LEPDEVCKICDWLGELRGQKIRNRGKNRKNKKFAADDNHQSTFKISISLPHHHHPPPILFLFVKRTTTTTVKEFLHLICL